MLQIYYLVKNVTNILFSKECYRCTMVLAYEGWKLNVNEEWGMYTTSC